MDAQPRSEANDAVSASALAPAAGKISLWEKIKGNPVLTKELRSRMRGRRAFVVLTIYLALLGLFVALVYLLFRTADSPVGPVNNRQQLGKAIFGMLMGLELMGVCFIAPALTAGAISSEREHQTYDLLRTTLLSAPSLVFGKFFTSLAYTLLLIFAALPLQSLAFLFGGVALEELLGGTLMLVVTAAVFSAAGLFFSSFVKRTLVSTVIAYGFTLLLVIGLPVLLVITLLFLDAGTSGPGPQISITGEIMIILTGWLFVALNPLAAAIASEIVLLEEHSLLLFQLPTPSSSATQITLISPWLPYCLFYILLTLLLLWFSVRFVRRVER